MFMKVLMLMPENTAFPSCFFEKRTKFIQGFVNMFSEIPAYKAIMNEMQKTIIHHYILLGLCKGISMECDNDNHPMDQKVSDMLKADFKACIIPDELNAELLAQMTLPMFKKGEETELTFMKIAHEIALVAPRLTTGFEGRVEFFDQVQSMCIEGVMEQINDQVAQNIQMEMGNRIMQLHAYYELSQVQDPSIPIETVMQDLHIIKVEFENTSQPLSMNIKKVTEDLKLPRGMESAQHV